MKTKKIVIAVLLALIALLLIGLGVHAFMENRTGTPIIIRFAGDGIEDTLSLGWQNAQSQQTTAKGGIGAIQVTADKKVWTYKIPDIFLPSINLVTDPTDCNISIADRILLDTKIGFDESVIKWNGTDFRTKRCKLQSLQVKARGLGIDCTNPHGTDVCEENIDLNNVRELEIKINY